MYDKEYDIKFDNTLDLKNTIESGQTFLWNRENGEMFSDSQNPAYTTCRYYQDECVSIRLTQTSSNSVKVQSNKTFGKNIVEKTLGRHQYKLDEVQDSIIQKDTNNGIMKEAVNKYPGLRIVNEPLFPTLISFICSTQMRVERIHQMVNNLKEKYGSKLENAGSVRYAFPTADQLSKATVEELRELKLGYRAGYVVNTTGMFNEEEFDLPTSTEEARKSLKQFKGVGTKVADCVLLYGGGLWNVVPVDTWIKSAVEEHYPEFDSDSNEEIARKFEEHFGDFAGFAQAYIFHYMRSE